MSHCSRKDRFSPPVLFRSLLLIPEVALRPHYISPGTKGSWRDDRDSLEYRYTRGRAISRLRATPVESALLLLRVSLACLGSRRGRCGSCLIAQRPRSCPGSLRPPGLSLRPLHACLRLQAQMLTCCDNAAQRHPTVK